jgi:hypothetical protein
MEAAGQPRRLTASIAFYRTPPKTTFAASRLRVRIFLLRAMPSLTSYGLGGVGSGGLMGVSAARMAFCTAGLDRFPK